MKKLLFFAFILAAGNSALAQTTTFTPVVLTGFTDDVVANGAGTVASSTTTDVDGASFAFVAMNYVSPTNASPTTALPNSGTITSAVTSTPGVTYQLAPYTGNNSLRIAAPGTGTLTFSQPRAADQLYILATSGSGISVVTITVNFTDASTQVLTGQSISDWYGGTNYAMQGLSRVSRSTNAIENSTINPRLYQIPLTITAANSGKTIASVSFNKTSTTGVLNVMGITARFITPAMANDVGVSAVTGLSTGCALTNQETISISINNAGTASQSNFQVSYKINNQTPVTENFTGTIAPFGTATHVFATKANLSTVGSYRIQGKALLTGDGNAINDTASVKATNSLLPALPVTLDFESATTGLGVFQKVTNSHSNIMEATAASTGSGTKVLILEGVPSASWVIPTGVVDPWTANPNHKAIAKICVNPAGGAATDPLWLSFDLKQLFRGANANTNLRVTVNGTPIGGNQTAPANTYRPPFNGTPIVWQRINLNLTSFKSQPSLEIAFESSVNDAFTNGTGNANMIDNIQILRSAPAGVKNDLTENLVNLFPNPSNGIFNLNAVKAGYSLEVTDLTGRTILQQKVAGKTAQLDLNNQANGIYLLKIESDGKTGIRKIIVE